MIKTALKLALLGGLAVAAVSYLAPGPVAAAYGWINSRIGFTAETCAVAPQECFEAREASLKKARIKLRHARGQAESGVKAIDAEETSERQLLDSNVGLQAVLRARATEMIRRGTDHLSFEGRNYTRTDVEQQAGVLVREEAGFRATLAEFGPRRARLHEARTAAVIEENRVAAALATISAEKAIVIATGSLDHAKRLLEETQFAENMADQLTEAVVRSTKEIAPPAPRVAGMPARTFNFDEWLGKATTNAPTGIQPESR
jgi:hypothetical protein